jgi:large subunit ribosomal protein L1
MASKRYKKAAEAVNKKAVYALDQAVGVLKSMAGTKFDETVEISASLNIDPKKSDQLVRGTVILPHGTGRVRKVAVFCKGEKEIQAKEAGADVVGGAELIQKVADGWMDFDVAVATPDMMRDVSRLGKILGPRGMMPNPKTGTVTDDVAKAIKDVKQGKVEFKMDKTSNIHFVIGKKSFQPQQLIDNGKVAIDAIVRARPATLKGKMLRKMSLSSTMSPGITLKTEGLEGDLSGEE